MEIRFILILLFVSITCFGQEKPITSQYIDSILTEGKFIQDDLERIDFYCSNASNHTYIPITKRLLDTSLQIATKSNHPQMLGDTYYALGNYFTFNYQLDTALVMLHRAETQAQKINSPFFTSKVLSTKGRLYKKKHELSTAVQHSLSAKQLLEGIDTTTLKANEKVNRHGWIMELNNQIANTYNDLEDFETAIIYYDLAIQSAKDLKEEGSEGVLLSNKGELLFKMKKYKQALEAFKIGKQLKKKANAPITYIASSDLNIGIALQEIGNKEEAIQYYNNALKLYEEINLDNRIAKTLSYRGLLYIEKEYYNDAIEDCERAKKIIKKLKTPEFLDIACECLYNAYKRKGDLKKSLLNHELMTRTKDSIMNEKNIRNLTQIEMRYQFNKKEEEQLKVIEAGKRKQKNIIIGLISFLVISVLIIASLRKKIQYKNLLTEKTAAIQKQEIIELQQKSKLLAMSSMIEGQEAERLRIAKDLHDSLGGLLSTVKAHFTGIQNEVKKLDELHLTTKTNALIDEACVEVRRISHNMMPHALSISGLKGAIEDLGAHLNEQGYTTSVEISTTSKTIDTTKKITIYRLVQEITSNIRKHSKAKNILIQIIYSTNEINLTIEDDGIGFNYLNAIKKGGLGLKNINSRVEYLDGTIDWNTQPNEGTSITINIPNL